MKKYSKVFLLFIVLFGIGNMCYAATVGNPLDLDIPAKSSVLRQDIIQNTLDEVEQVVKVKSSFDVEFVFDKDLNSSTEIVNPEIRGVWYMAKLGLTLFDKIEPYVKVGSSDLKVRYRQGPMNIELEADYGFAWGGGVKAIILEPYDWGIRLTGDVQYRTTEADVEDVTMGSQDLKDPGPCFKVDEWQVALILSKKFELPLRWQSLYIVPYTGVTVSDSTVDIEVTPRIYPGLVLSTYDANNESIVGFLMGCDILMDLRSWYMFNMELRLINEFALTLGGTIKF